MFQRHVLYSNGHLPIRQTAHKLQGFASRSPARPQFGFGFRANAGERLEGDALRRASSKTLCFVCLSFSHKQTTRSIRATAMCCCPNATRWRSHSLLLVNYFRVEKRARENLHMRAAASLRNTQPITTAHNCAGPPSQAGPAANLWIFSRRASKRASEQKASLFCRRARGMRDFLSISHTESARQMIRIEQAREWACCIILMRREFSWRRRRPGEVASKSSGNSYSSSAAQPDDTQVARAPFLICTGRLAGNSKQLATSS